MPATAKRLPRRSSTDKAILDAAREILAAEGVGGLTVEGVAARAGVAKTTIYRRYRSKHEMALAVLVEMVQHVVAVPDLGNTRAELISFVNGAVTVLDSSPMGRVMQGLVSDFAADPQLAAAFREQVVTTRLAEVRRLVDVGVARGDLRPDTDHELAHELLFGPIYYRLMLSGAPLEGDLAHRLTDAFMRAFAPVPQA